ncbi:nucleoporin NDC1 [Schistocerca gregaria]|uniref:nucleoporin NDC1 n=1 Tax=Schistocerca gregaria TaxID=7010 RepID=UPI00211DCC2E|nr:nucleoporin NDC1 [Schistocerca gregaria]
MNEGKKICSRRILSAVTWTIIFEILLACAFLAVIHFDFWSPLTWMMDAVTVLVSPKTWVFFIPVMTCTVSFVYLHGSEFANVTPYTPNRISCIQRTLTLHNGCLALSLLLLSTFSSFFYLSVINERSPSRTGTGGSSVVEENLYLIVGSVFVGVYIFITECILQANALQYPVVQQLRLIQIKEEFLNLLKQSIIRSISPVVMFAVLYLIFGSALRNCISNLLSLKIAGNASFNVMVVFYFYGLTFFYVFAVTAGKYLLNLHLTERCVFPIVINESNTDKIKLADAMALQQLPLIQNLAYLDLKLLAEKDLVRRQQLYILSQPGGHPYNWNGVISECIKLIKSYTEFINLACMEMSGEKCGGGVSSQKREIPQLTLPKANSVSMRNLSLVSLNESVQESVSPLGSNISFSDAIKSYWTQIVDYICKNTVVSYFCGVVPDSRLHWALSQAYPVIWAAQGLAFITTASFKEDDYGISLRDLPNIIISLVNLNRAVIKIPKFVVQKKTRYVEARSNRMKQALKSALERSLFKLIITYDIYLREIKLPVDIFQELQNFRNQLEG